MTDIVSPAVRSRMMSGIKSKNTKPEIILRKQLHGMGFRYRLHDRRLPGTPDMVFPKYHAVIFIHGCFWHGHECSIFKWPSSNTEFWINKINANKERDNGNKQKLLEAGWRIAIVWECAVRKSGYTGKSVVRKLADWISGDSAWLEVAN